MSSREGTVAVVTGAGRGIGRAIALQLAAEGARVVLCARSTAQLEAVAGDIGDDDRVLVVSSDLSDPSTPRDLVDRTLEAFGQVDVLVNAAGISPVWARAEETSIDDWQAIMDTNVRGAFLLAQATGRHMLSRKSGVIVNLASIGGLVALPRLVAYCAAKAAIISMTKVMAVEWADRGVRVNAVAPAYVLTAMTEGLASHPRLGAELIKTTPLQRLAMPEEIAAAVAFMASREASFITGETLVVDGGWTAL